MPGEGGADHVRAGGAAGAGEVLRALGCAAFVVVAVALEVAGGAGANSPAPAWAEVVFPIAWPQPVRVVWWLAVAAAAFGYRACLRVAGFPQWRFVTTMTVAPFVVFAAGVAAGASWATWH